MAKKQAVTATEARVVAKLAGVNRRIKELSDKIDDFFIRVGDVEDRMDRLDPPVPVASHAAQEDVVNEEGASAPEPAREDDEIPF